jgi:hypothetical protein
MSYRTRTPDYIQDYARPQPATPSALRIMVAMLVTFVVVSFLVFFAGRLPVTPQPLFPVGPTYRQYAEQDSVLLSSYGNTFEGNVHIPIDRAMDLIVERGLPVRNNPSATP